MSETPRALSKRIRPGKDQSEESDPYFSRAVGKALEALDRLSGAGNSLTLSELTASLSLTKASTFRLLHTLETLGYISKTNSGQYVLAGPWQPQVPARLVNQMIHVGSEPIERLAMQFRETVGLAALLDNHIEVVAIMESPQLIRMGNTLGRILPPHASALGKAITAFQKPEMREKLLRSYGTPVLTPHTIADEIALRKEFANIEQQGHAEDWEESTLGGCCFAAPILRPSGVAAGAVSLSMPQMRLTGPDHQKTLIAGVLQTAKEIETGLFKAATNSTRHPAKRAHT
jgi:IclR family acetate operon transcriptional repressor